MANVNFTRRTRRADVPGAVQVTVVLVRVSCNSVLTTRSGRLFLPSSIMSRSFITHGQFPFLSGLTPRTLLQERPGSPHPWYVGPQLLDVAQGPESSSDIGPHSRLRSRRRWTPTPPPVPQSTLRARHGPVMETRVLHPVQLADEVLPVLSEGFQTTLFVHPVPVVR